MIISLGFSDLDGPHEGGQDEVAHGEDGVNCPGLRAGRLIDVCIAMGGGSTMAMTDGVLCDFSIPYHVSWIVVKTVELFCGCHGNMMG